MPTIINAKHFVWKARTWLQSVFVEASLFPPFLQPYDVFLLRKKFLGVEFNKVLKKTKVIQVPFAISRR